MSFAQQVKEKINIVEFLGSYLQMKKAGANYKALCPFHREKTPSLVVSPDRQMWHCFGCGAGGDSIKFVMQFENVEFVDALKVLAEHAGIPMQSMKLLGARDEHEALYNVVEAATKYFTDQLQRTPEAMKYLLERGLKKETIEEFRLGFAPNIFDGFASRITKLGFRVQDAEKAGLISKSQKGMYFDRFRGRIMFPIMSHVGRVIGFSGRVLPWIEKELQAKGQETAKYMNSPETPIFYKSKILYGFHKTKIDIRKEDKVLLVEGQMDFLMSWQDCVKSVVATSGTALTEEHLATLRNYTENLILGFDNDKAGGMAAERSIDMANALDFNVLLVRFGELKDAADFVHKYPGKLSRQLEQAQSAMRFYFDRYLVGGMDHRQKKKAIQAILSKARMVSSPIEQSQWIRALAEATDINEQFLIAELQKASKGVFKDSGYISKGQQPSPASSLTASKDKLRIEHIVETLLALAAHQSELLEKIENYVEYIPETYRRVYEFMRSKEEAGEELQPMIDYLQLRSTHERDKLNEADPAIAVDILLYQLKLEWLKGRMQELGRIVKDAEVSGDQAMLERAIVELQSVSQEVSELQGHSFNK